MTIQEAKAYLDRDDIEVGTFSFKKKWEGDELEEWFISWVDKKTGDLGYNQSMKMETAKWYGTMSSGV